MCLTAWWAGFRGCQWWDRTRHGLWPAGSSLIPHWLHLRGLQLFFSRTGIYTGCCWKDFTPTASLEGTQAVLHQVWLLLPSITCHLHVTPSEVCSLAWVFHSGGLQVNPYFSGILDEMNPHTNGSYVSGTAQEAEAEHMGWAVVWVQEIGLALDSAHLCFGSCG